MIGRDPQHPSEALRLAAFEHPDIIYFPRLRTLNLARIANDILGLFPKQTP